MRAIIYLALVGNLMFFSNCDLSKKIVESKNLTHRKIILLKNCEHKSNEVLMIGNFNIFENMGVNPMPKCEVIIQKNQRQFNKHLRLNLINNGSDSLIFSSVGASHNRYLPEMSYGDEKTILAPFDTLQVDYGYKGHHWTGPTNGMINIQFKGRHLYGKRFDFSIKELSE